MSDEAYLQPTKVFDLDSPEVLASLNGSNPITADLLSIQGVVELAPAEDLIEGVISERSFSVLYGKYGSGKSFVALDMAISVARGLPWHGHEVRQGPVIYVLAEGTSGVRNRVLAWHNGRQVDTAPCFFYPRPVSLLDSKSVNYLVDTAKNLKADLVVFDTLNQSLVGGDENSSVHMGQAIRALKDVQEQAQTAVLVIHHTGHNGELRGHSSLPAAADHIIRAWSPEPKDEDPNPNLVVLYSKKVKEGPRFDPVYLRLQTVYLENGNSSCRVVAA